jgi:hypothetical protein
MMANLALTLRPFESKRDVRMCNEHRGNFTALVVLHVCELMWLFHRSFLQSSFPHIAVTETHRTYHAASVVADWRMCAMLGLSSE